MFTGANEIWFGTLVIVELTLTPYYMITDAYDRAKVDYKKIGSNRHSRW